MATGSFPYKGCQNDFEVLTCVLERDPPSLPIDQGFSLEFQHFVNKWWVIDFFFFQCSLKTEIKENNLIVYSPSLTKDYRNRPKYPELLEMSFIKMYENADIDVATWFASVMHNQQPNDTEPRR